MSCSYCTYGRKPITTPDGSFVRHSNYCDNCGESFLERKPLTLDELKCNMDGLPVWVVTLEEPELNPPFWAIVDTDYKQNVGVRLVSKDNPDDFGAYELYGETWIAYDQKIVR